MNIVKGTHTCGVCKAKDAVVFCDGCEIPLCGECQIFDLWGYGCGHVDTKAFCQSCHEDIEINPYGGRRPE